ncbi:MAG: hypothetical protein IMZ43_09585 [Thermoplasmata archaeon]|nr:hypothetical protein [Thermoplasmata archaeon]
MITIEDIKTQFSKYLCLSDTDVIDVMLGTVIANRMPGDSVSLYIIGPSSSAKTELVRSLIDYSHSYHLTKITPHTLVSGFQDRAKKGENFSLLTKLQKEGRNILVFKDFTTILSMRREDRSEFISQLREMADGYICGDYGNAQHFELKEHIGVIAACTNAIDEFDSVNGVLGERFLKYRISAEMAEAIAKIAMESNNDKEGLRNEAARLVVEFLGRFEVICDLPTWYEECRSRIQNLCIFGAHLRSPIIKDPQGIQLSPVDHEGPGRLISSLDKLAKGIAMVQGESIISPTVYPIIKKVVKDTVPPYRLLVVKSVFEHEEITTKDLATDLHVHWRTAQKYCEDLRSIGILRDTKDSENRNLWSINESYVKWIKDSQIFVIDRF